MTAIAVGLLIFFVAGVGFTIGGLLGKSTNMIHVGFALLMVFIVLGVIFYSSINSGIDAEDSVISSEIPTVSAHPVSNPPETTIVIYDKDHNIQETFSGWDIEILEQTESFISFEKGKDTYTYSGLPYKTHSAYRSD